MTFADEYGEFFVYLKQGAQISSKILSLNDKIQITGIVSQYNDEYRILPRSQNDLVNFTWLENPVAGEVQQGEQQIPASSSRIKILWGLLTGFVILCFCNLYFLWQKKAQVAEKFQALRKIVVHRWRPEP